MGHYIIIIIFLTVLKKKLHRSLHRKNKSKIMKILSVAISNEKKKNAKNT